MAQKKYSHGACFVCKTPLEQLPSDDDLIVRFRCNHCLKQFDFYIRDGGFLERAVITDFSKEVHEN